MELVGQYAELCASKGADLALGLSNAVLTAERLECSRHWGAFEGQVELQVEASLVSWALVEEQRMLLDEFVHKELWGMVEEARKLLGKDEAHVELLERDLELRSGLAFSLGVAGKSQDETLALLSVWSASTVLKG